MRDGKELGRRVKHSEFLHGFGRWRLFHSYSSPQIGSSQRSKWHAGTARASSPARWIRSGTVDGKHAFPLPSLDHIQSILFNPLVPVLSHRSSPRGSVTSPRLKRSPRSLFRIGCLPPFLARSAQGSCAWAQHRVSSSYRSFSM